MNFKSFKTMYLELGHEVVKDFFTDPEYLMHKDIGLPAEIAGYIFTHLGKIVSMTDAVSFKLIVRKTLSYWPEDSSAIDYHSMESLWNLEFYPIPKTGIKLPEFKDTLGEMTLSSGPFTPTTQRQINSMATYYGWK